MARTVAAMMVLFFCHPAHAQWQEESGWAAIFEAAEVEGTIAILDQRSGDSRYRAYNAERAGQRYSPASTFKIPHSLFALNAGVVADEFEVIEWDGEKRWLDAWNRDQDLRSSMRNSVVWVYQKFAREIGEEREYMEKIDYGNADPSGGIDDTAKRKSITRDALRSVGALPKSDQEKHR